MQDSEKEEKEEVLDRLERSQKIKKLLVISIISVILVIIIFISFPAYFYFKSPEHNLGVGANIESVLISADGKTSYLKLAGGSLDKNITKIKFIFTDADSKEFIYETSEGIKEIEVPYTKTIWDYILGIFGKKPDYLGSYNYDISSDELGIDNFNNINEVGVLFEYKTETGEIIETPVLDTAKPIITKTTGGGGGGGGGNGGTTTCTPESKETTCGSWVCGSKINNCNEDVNCGNCSLGYGCDFGKCILQTTGLYEGLVAYWKFEDETFGITPDETGVNPGNLINNADIISDAEKGNVLSLDGDDDYIDAGNDSSLNLQGSLTLSAWIKLFELGGGLSGRIISKGQDNFEPYAGFTFRIRNLSGMRLGYAVYGGYMQSSPDIGNIINQWTQVALVWNQSGDGNISFYINGIRQSSFNYTGNYSGYFRGNPKDSSNYPLLIGIKQNASGSLFDWFNGSIDEVMLYNRALNESEIKQIYDSQKPKEVNTYYVSPLGTGDCSLSSPCSLDFAVANVKPNSEVYLQAGTYASLVPNISGNYSSMPIKFIAYNNEDVKIDYINLDKVNYVNIINLSAKKLWQWGINWSFNDYYDVGTFVNDDFWVLPNSAGGNVSIVGIEPESKNYTSQITHNGKNYTCIKNHVSNSSLNEPEIGSNWTKYWEIGGDGSDGSWKSDTMYHYNIIMHGSMLNPSVMSDGFDSRSMSYNINSMSYNINNNLNVAYGVSLLSPLNLKKDSSLISTISWIDCNELGAPCIPGVGLRPKLKSAAILTILPNAVPQNSFRPPYFGSDKTIKYNLNDLDYSKLSKLEPIGGELILHKDILNDATNQKETVERYFERPWLDWLPEEPGRNVHPTENMLDYGAFIASQTGVGSLVLQLNYTNQEKELLLTRYVQLGIDLYGVIWNYTDDFWTFGPWYGAGGGGGAGRKLPILFAGIILNDSDMKNIGNKWEDTSSADWKCFGEDGQAFYVKEGDIYEKPYEMGIDNYGCDASWSYGTVDVTKGSNIVKGQGASWTKGVINKTFGISDDISRIYTGNKGGYKIIGVNAANQEMTLETPYEGETDTNKIFSVAHGIIYGHGDMWQNRDYGEFTEKDLGLPNFAFSGAYNPGNYRTGTDWPLVYQHTGTDAWGGGILAVQIMNEKTNLKNLWNRNSVFDFSDRKWEIDSLWSDILWISDMWDTYRKDYGCFWTRDNQSDVFSNGHYNCSNQLIKCIWQNSTCSNCDLVSDSCVVYNTQRACEYDPCGLHCSWNGNSCVECIINDTRSCDTSLLGVCNKGTQTCHAPGNWGSCTANIKPGNQTEICHNGLDDDCDGLPDCADSVDCRIGSETNCTDLIDNDCDGLRDCSDIADCSAYPGCELPNVPQGYVSWWRFEGDTRDLTGNNDGNIIGELQYTQGISGIHALEFKGGHVETLTNLFNYSNGTWMAWVKPATAWGTDDKYYNILYSGNKTLTDLGWTNAGMMYYRGESKKLVTIWGPDNMMLESSLGWNANEWHHVAMTFKKNKLLVYIDGVLVNSDGSCNGPDGFGDKLIIGGGSSSPMNGTMDEVMIYNRALNSSEIEAIYCNQGGDTTTCQGWGFGTLNPFTRLWSFLKSLLTGKTGNAILTGKTITGNAAGDGSGKSDYEKPLIVIIGLIAGIILIIVIIIVKIKKTKKKSKKKIGRR